MTLNAVVLPAPFGPISPAISPCFTVSESSSSARIPPKRRLTLSTSSSATGASFSQKVENRHVTTVQPRRANQPPPLEGYDLYGENRPLVEAVAREGAASADAVLRSFGTVLGGEPLELGRLANEHPPRLRTHDRFGERVDEVEFHPAWHALLGLGVEHGLHASPWREPRPGAHVARAAAFITLAGVEAGVGCPLSMTFAAVPALRAEPALLGEWAPLLTSTVYDPGLRPSADKAGALCGMAMTERQGGSDVRANETVARPDRPDPPRRRGSHASRSAPHGLRARTRRAAADGERARGPLHRLGGGDAARAAARARVRRGRCGVSPARDGGREVLGLQGDA